MVAVKKMLVRALEGAENTRGLNRTADWLEADYRSHVWTVRDTHGGGDKLTIDFRYPMPNGKTLVDFPELYESVKEFTFLLRGSKFIRIDDAESHASLARCLMIIAHGIVLDGLTSFRHATRDYLAVFQQRILGANDGITRASERILDWLNTHDRLSAEQLRDKLPLAAQSKKVSKLRTKDFLSELGLPPSTANLPRAAHLIGVVRTRAQLLGANGATIEGTPPLEKFTATTLLRYFQVLELLYAMRSTMRSECLPESPFEQSANSLAELHGIGTTRTPIPPPKLALHLMSQAMVWVKNYSQPLLELVKKAKSIPKETREHRDSREEAFDILAASYPQSGPQGSPWPLFANQVRRDNDTPSLHQTVTMLITACLIVIATFSARRLDELNGLAVGDIKGTSSAGWWLRPFIQKTLLSKNWIPTAEVVSTAFEVLKELSIEAREALGNDLIVQWESPFYTEPKIVSGGLSEDNINMFAAAVGTPDIKDANGSSTKWHWTTHQFRRFFAVLYFYRYRGARIEDLAHFLRHFDLNMTRRYLEITPQQKKEFSEIERLYLGDLGQELLSQKGQSIGAGKALKKMLEDHFHTVIQVSAPSIEDIGDFLLRLKSSRGLELHPKPWADCTCPNTREGAKTAACASERRVKNAVGPDFTVARPSVCLNCPHPVPNRHFDEQLDLEKSSLKVVSTSDLFKGTLLQGIADAGVAEIRRYQEMVLE